MHLRSRLSVSRLGRVGRSVAFGGEESGDHGVGHLMCGVIVFAVVDAGLSLEVRSLHRRVHTEVGIDRSSGEALRFAVASGEICVMAKGVAKPHK